MKQEVLYIQMLFEGRVRGVVGERMCCFEKPHYLNLVQEPVKCAFSNYFGQVEPTTVHSRGGTLFWKQFLQSICCLKENL